MDDSTVETLAILALVATLLVIAVLSRRRKRPFTLRHIAAYAAMPDLVGRAIEADQPLHIGIGSAGIGGESTALALAAAELAYLLARRAAIGDTSPILTLSNASALPLGQDSLRRGYQARGYGDRFNPTATRWYPNGSRSLTYAAAVTTMMHDENVSGSVLVGSHGPEIGLMLLSSSRMAIPTVAASDQLDGQAVAYALGNQALIGEEVFVAQSYLDDDPNGTKIAVIIDVLRWGLVAAMLAAFVLSIGG